MRLYIYTLDNKQTIDYIDGETNKECEDLALALYWDTDVYGWTYSPAFGCADGLID
ncbi:hypothetical protein KLEP7_gp78 [Pseudaeromonas phage vB_PpeM_ KLEP7]|nr:hypothetical protein KLEP7_gp78 [Pseudaeromonas phage vB_PpeM_ KLEP7]